MIYTMNVDGSNVTLISPTLGRTTCSFVLNDGRIIYSSTMSGCVCRCDALRPLVVTCACHCRQATCPPTPDASAGYLWPIYKHMQIYIGTAGEEELRR